MIGLIAWLRAQLDWQEAALNAYRQHRDVCYHDGYGPCEEHVATAHGIDYRDAIFGLADIAAKRRILAEAEYEIHDAERRDTGDGLGLSQTILALLALPYAGRPGYRKEWRPQ